MRVVRTSPSVPGRTPSRGGVRNSQPQHGRPRSTPAQVVVDSSSTSHWGCLGLSQKTGIGGWAFKPVVSHAEADLLWFGLLRPAETTADGDDVVLERLWALGYVESLFLFRSCVAPVAGPFMKHVSLDQARLQEIVAFYIHESQSPDLRTYGQGFLDHFDRAVHAIRQVMSLGRMRSARILDLGCGFGWHALLIAVLGDNEVVANDVRELMTENVQNRVAAVEQAFGLSIRVRTLLGDFTTLDIPPCSFDAIFSNQTIEHIHDLGACFRRAHEILRPGGRLVVTNDNNCLTRRHMQTIEAMWKQRDTSAEFIQELRRERPEENRDAEPYAMMREKILHEAFPQLVPQTVRMLTDATAGQVQFDILVSAGRYLQDGSLPRRSRYAWCRNPRTGEYCERQFNPFELKQQLRSIGFRVRLLQTFRRGGPLRLLSRFDCPPLNRLLFRWRESFVLACVRN